MSTRWSRQRKTATEAGAFHAQGGDDRRGEFASRGADLRDAYDKGFQNEQQDQARRQAEQNHPLRAISRKAQGQASNPWGTDATRAVAGLVERLADYLIETGLDNGR